MFTENKSRNIFDDIIYKIYQKETLKSSILKTYELWFIRNAKATYIRRGSQT